MSGQVQLIWYGEGVPWYDHGPDHPLRPAAVLLTRQLIHDYGLLVGGRASEVEGRDATDAELLLVHGRQYLDAVKQAGRGEQGPWWRFGLGPGDNPIFPHMHEASARVVGCSLAAAEAVLSGRAAHAFNPGGGLHHAMPERASGFCVYDDPAIVIAWLLERDVGRVAYVDVDVHHGDGPQAIFYGDPRVLTISLHQTGRTLFPGTGFISEQGEGGALGTKVNVALPPFTGDRMWLAAFDELVPPLVEAWQPDVLVTQLGCDTHHTDPLANLMLTTAAYRETASRLHDLAHRAAGGRWVATGGGGYQWAQVVPRAWTLYFAEMAGGHLPDELPSTWLERVADQLGRQVPSRLSEPSPQGPVVEDDVVRQVIDEVREAVFPVHGLPV